MCIRDRSFMKRLKVFVNFNFHIVEFNLNAIEQCIIIRCTRRNIIKGINQMCIRDSLKQLFRKCPNKALCTQFADIYTRKMCIRDRAYTFLKAQGKEVGLSLVRCV